MLAYEIADLLGVDRARSVNYISACDKDFDCREEASIHPANPGHIFRDVEEQISNEAHQHIRALKGTSHFTFQGMTRYLLSRTDVVKSRVRCEKCNADCPLEKAGTVVAGIPCVNITPVGDQMKYSGYSMTSWAVFFTVLMHLGDSLAIIECSSLIDPLQIENIVGNTYIMVYKAFCCTSIGWPNRRRRWYAILIHRCNVLLHCCHLDSAINLFTRVCACTFNVFLVATQNELNEELQWALERRSSRLYGYSADEVACLDFPMEDALTNLESHLLERTYRANHPNTTYNLSQASFETHGTADVSHCMTHNGPDFVDEARRWFVPNERLLQLGFPVYDGLASRTGECWPVCSFNVPRTSSERTRQNLMNQAGNSMNLPVMGIMWVFAYLFVIRSTLEDKDGLDSFMIDVLLSNFECH